MKSQKHNQGELANLSVEIEKNVVEALKEMSKNSGLSEEEIVVVSIKRYMATHSDYIKKTPQLT